MIAWKQPLAGFEWLIHQVWYLEVPADVVIDPKPHLIPNPRSHLLFTPPAQPYHYSFGDNQMTGVGCHLLAPNEHLLLLDDHAPLKRIGITFRPEGLYLLNENAVSINRCGWTPMPNEMFGLEFQARLWEVMSGTEVTGLDEGYAVTMTSQRAALLVFLEEYFQQLSLETKKDRSFLIAQTVTLEMDKNADVTIEQLVACCACSRRTLERSFKQVTGLSLKQYQQMNRLEHIVLALYGQGHAIDWTELSHQFGFSDQSHLIRTLKKQLNKTPSKYLKNRDLTIDIYGDFE